MIHVPYWNDIAFYFSQHSFSLFISLILLIIGGFCIVLVSLLLRKFFSRTYYDETLERFAQRGISIFLWIILFIFIFSNLGVDVTGFIAGLGIAGFIIGFATKDIFSNIAAGFLILITKPFKVGDDVEISGLRGVVKESPKMWKGFGNLQVFGYFPHESVRWFKKVKVRLFSNKNKDVEERLKISKRITSSEIKWLPDKVFMPVVWTIFGANLLIIIYEPEIIVLRIRSKTIVKSFDAQFDYLWEQ
ncbi:MAG: hypothetical protein RL557_768 [archaeon]|jgi:hypothetical protein